MASTEMIRQEMLQEFAEAYRTFGLSKLMGRVMALLIYSPLPLSLDEIAANLEMSKGPISQITRRLRDHNLIRKIWKPRSRKDYYEITPDVFENAFRNNLGLIKNNTKIASQLKTKITQNGDSALDALHLRLTEMQRFYELMEKHFQNFLDEWSVERKNIYQQSR